MSKQQGDHQLTSSSTQKQSSKFPKVAVIGAGYWGRNHIRNFYQLDALKCVCDTKKEILSDLLANYKGVKLTESYEDILKDSSIDAVVLATPAVDHASMAIKAIEAGKDVLVEKPLALSVEEAKPVVDLAEQKKAILMVGHILLYHPAVQELKRLVDDGSLGKILYVQSNRLSMGKVRSEENILWSFAPHDISMILHLIGEPPQTVRAFGASYLQEGIEDVTVSILDFSEKVSAHIYVSWMHAFKEHRLVVTGEKRTAVFEDSRSTEKLRIFDSSFEWLRRRPAPVKGGIHVIELDELEPLTQECAHFLKCIETRQPPKSDGKEGLATLDVLEKCFNSMKKVNQRSETISMGVSQRGKAYFAHPTAVVDEPCSIGPDVQIWHFSHVMKNAEIGAKSKLGQNVLVGKGVKIGENCKIQNNVSVYAGVTLEDHVFCGPSMVFTNVHNPRCEIPRMSELKPTLVKRGATIGANATIICGNTIGIYAFIGSGAVVTKDAPDYALMMGTPARRVGWMCRCGVRLEAKDNSSSVWECGSCGDNYHLQGTDKIVRMDPEAETPRIPLLDLEKQNAPIRDECMRAIKGVIDNNRFIMGPEVEGLEKEIADYCGSRYAVGVTSGTDALLVSLMALGVGPGDEIITSPFTFFATVGSVLRVGAKVVFADIDPVTFNIDPKQVERLVNKNTKAIIPVHLFGQCADMDPILQTAKEKGVPVIEDAAQAIGSDYKDRRAGAIGTLGCFSFFPSKNLGAFGDGGMVTTNDPELAELIKILRAQGSKPKYYHKVVGGNFRLDAIQAAILRVKMRYLESWHEMRQTNANHYTRLFNEHNLLKHVTPPKVVEKRHIFNQYVIRVPKRDELKNYLSDNGVTTEIYYPAPVHLQECMGDAGYKEGDFPVTEAACLEVLALPIYPGLAEANVEYIVSKIKEFYTK